MVSKPLLIGESNPYGSSPDFALYPSPRGCSGERLCRLVLALDPDEYLERFDRANLCAGNFSAPAAETRMWQLLAERERVVLLGRKVAHAFRRALPGHLAPASWTSGLAIYQPARGAAIEVRYVCLPHPSGLCREWGKPGAFDRARALLRQAGML